MTDDTYPVDKLTVPVFPSSAMRLARMLPLRRLFGLVR